jgi:hypothetical protein
VDDIIIMTRDAEKTKKLKEIHSINENYMLLNQEDFIYDIDYGILSDLRKPKFRNHPFDNNFRKKIYQESEKEDAEIH